MTAGILSLIAAGVTAYLLWKQIKDTRRLAREKELAAHRTSKITMIHTIKSISETVDEMKSYWERQLNACDGGIWIEHPGETIEWAKSDLDQFANFIAGLSEAEVRSCLQLSAEMQLSASAIAPGVRAHRGLPAPVAIEYYVMLIRIEKFAASMLEYCRGRKKALGEYGVVDGWLVDAQIRGLHTGLRLEIGGKDNNIEKEINCAISRGRSASGKSGPIFGSGLSR